MPILTIYGLPQAAEAADTDLFIVETDDGTKSIDKKSLLQSIEERINSTEERINSTSCISSPASYFTTDGAGTITGLTDEGKDVSELVIPKRIDGIKVTSIGESAFNGCTSLTSIIIPDSVTSIGNQAFSHCTSLTSIIIPNSVTSIGSAFIYCTSLSSVTIPDSVTSIGSAFHGCTNLTSVNIPNGVTSIGGSAFQDCASLTSITIPDSVTSIGSYAFYGCTNLTNIIIPDNVTNIDSYAFDGCTSLTSITIPGSIISIGNMAFIKCTALITVNYTGTEEEWKKIIIDTYNTPLVNATKVFNYGTPIQKLPVVNSEDAGKSLKVSETGEWIVGESSNVATPDWNQNDETAPDYIKNRTHYVGDPVETVLIPEQTVAFEVSGEMGEAASPVTIDLVEGQSYTVNFDGVTYECIGKTLHGVYLYIGSPTIFELEDTGEPFIYLYANGQSVWVAYDAETEHTLSLATVVSEIVKIPDEFLPDYDFAGKTVSGKRIMGHDGNEYVGGMYAEIFNDLTNKASGVYSHAEGEDTTASGNRSHAEGGDTVASGDRSHAEGYRTTASSPSSHAEGHYTTASSPSSHAEGHYTNASGDVSHAEGGETVASGPYSHAEGCTTTASASYSHAEGSGTTASSTSSHAEGFNTTASGEVSHAEGYNTTASANYSHAEGYWTNAGSSYQHVQGKYNIEDTNTQYAHIVGNGTSKTAHSNAHTLDWNGLGWFAGGLKVGGTGQDDTNAVEVATLANAEEWVFTLEDGSTVTKKVVLG